MENEKDRSFEETNNETPGTTVLFELEYEKEEYSAKSRGSGFFIESDKIVTCVHVLAGATKITVRHVDKEKSYTIEGVVAFDDKNDLVILKISEQDKPFSLGDSNTVRKKDKVYVIGYPDGKEISVERSVQGFQYSGKHIILDNKLSQGNSGGPVLNGKGEVIGIAVSIKIPIDNNSSTKGVAISSNELKLLLDEDQHVESIEEWQKRPQIQSYEIFNLGDEKREEGRYQEAIEYYDTAIELNSQLAYIYQNRAATKMTLGRFNEAFSDRITSLKLNSEKFSLTGFGIFLRHKWEILRIYGLSLFMSILCGVLGKSKWVIIQASIKADAGKKRAEQGNIPEARNLFLLAVEEVNENIKHYPKRSKSHNSRGWIKYLFGQFETEYGNTSKALKLFKEAIVDADEALRLELKKEKYQYAFFHTRAAAKSSIGGYNDAIEDFNESIRLNPKKALLYRDRGLAKDALNQYEEALKDFQIAIELKSKEAINYFHSGVTKNKIGDHKGALANLDIAIQLDQTNENAYYQRGVSYEMLGQEDKAKSDYKEVFKLNPNAQKKTHKLGVAKCNLRLYEQAITLFDKTIKLDPKYYKGYLCRGCMKQTFGQDQDAIIDFDIALKLNPKAPAAYRNRGVVKRKLGAYEDALQDLNEAIRLNPDDGKAYNARGNTYKALQLHSEADTDFAKAKELKTNREICYLNLKQLSDTKTITE